MIIAVDGPAASGKGTIARRLAEHYSLRHLDTGLLYRAVAHAMLAAGLPLDDAAAAADIARRLDPESFDIAALKARGVGEAASQVAAHAAVRTALLDLQRAFAAKPPGAVLDGRDIGTVICPDADVKLYITATAEERARRRAAEWRAAGQSVDEAQVLAAIRARDDRDMGRAVAPLAKAGDAHLLETTNLDIEAAFRAAVAIVDGA